MRDVWLSVVVHHPVHFAAFAYGTDKSAKDLTCDRMKMSCGWGEISWVAVFSIVHGLGAPGCRVYLI
ncbi:MAG: hypothetical protein AB8B62_03660 [Roseobacter sp.]